jgi:NAD-dependent deacetylase
MQDKILEVASLLRQSNHAVALTGAGISTESGIPDFRGPDGLWKKYDPFKVASIEAFMGDPAGYWKRALERKLSTDAEPNEGHRALAELEKIGRLKVVITQNVDGLHQKAGCKDVIELHGTVRTAHCLECGKRYPREEVVSWVEKGELPPRCKECGGIIKSDTVLFGESLPSDVISRAMEEARKCDVMLVLGSSLVVYPAASLPDIAIQSGARIVILNMEATEKDWIAEVVLHGKIGEILPKIVEEIKRKHP